MPSPLSPQQALIYALITISAVDSDMSDAELGQIGLLVRDLPAFASYDHDDLVLEAQSCGKVISGKNGLSDVLDMIRDGLPEHMYETAYALAADVAVSDRSVGREEIRFLELLAVKLGLDKLTCAALERGSQARHQKP